MKNIEQDILNETMIIGELSLNGCVLPIKGVLPLTIAAKKLAELGHVTRLSIFRYLVKVGDDGASVGQIQEELNIPGSTLSHHISRLVAVGLISVTVGNTDKDITVVDIEFVVEKREKMFCSGAYIVSFRCFALTVIIDNIFLFFYKSSFYIFFV